MFQDDLTDYILSGHALLSVITHEKDRAIEQVQAAAKAMKPQRKVFTWSIVTGWQADDGEGQEDEALNDTNKPDLANR